MDLQSLFSFPLSIVELVLFFSIRKHILKPELSLAIIPVEHFFFAADCICMKTEVNTCVIKKDTFP
jgi:hypothetical protein